MKLYAIIEVSKAITDVIEHTQYPSKKTFKEDLTLNGFKVKEIYSDADYDKAMNNVKKLGLMNISKRDEKVLNTFNAM